MPKYSDKAKANINKYLKAPSLSLVEEFISELEVKDAEFERFLGLRRSTICDIRLGLRSMPTHCWHWIYEKKLPSESQSSFKNKLLYGNSYKKTSKKPIGNNNNKQILGKLNTLKQSDNDKPSDI